MRMKLALTCCSSLAEQWQTLVTLDFGIEEVGAIEASGWLIVPNSFMRCSHFQLYRSEHANYRSPLICSLQARFWTLTPRQPSKVLHCSYFRHDAKHRKGRAPYSSVIGCLVPSFGKGCCQILEWVVLGFVKQSFNKSPPWKVYKAAYFHSLSF